MSKPAHRGRILVSSNRLEPLTGGSKSRNGNPQPPLSSTTLNTRRGSGSKSADNKNGNLVAAGTSALGGVSKDKLQRRVAELEFENQKLLNNLQKAEISIESYKSFLSEQSSRRAHSIAIQTDFNNETTADGPETSPSEKAKIVKLTKKLEDSNKRISELKIVVEDFAQHQEKNERSLSELRNEYNAFRMSTELAEVSYRTQIQSLENELQSLSTRPQNQSGHSPSVLTPPSQGLRKLKPRSSKKEYLHVSSPSSSVSPSQSALSSAIPRSSKSSETLPTSPISTVDRLTTKLSTDLLSPVSSAKKLKVKSPLPTPPLLPFKSKVTALKSFCQSSKDFVSQELDGFNTMLIDSSACIIREIERFKSKYISFLSCRDKKISGLQSLLAEERRSMVSRASLEKELTDAQQDMREDLETVQRALKKEKEQSMVLEGMINGKDERISELRTIFTSVSRELHNLQSKFKSESAAVKHMGHCKDLVRVATIRELTLEKDRALSELKYARDIQNVLSFCLESAATTLHEIQPHIVMKLNESRLKRSAVLEREVTARRKDLDQRSAETCAVSSTHLEAFHAKSTLKHQKAEEDTKALFSEIQNILNIKNSI